MPKLKWEGDTSTCRRWAIQTGHERDGDRWERYFVLWRGGGEGGLGPPWETTYLSSSSRREVKREAERLAAREHEKNL